VSKLSPKLLLEPYVDPDQDKKDERHTILEKKLLIKKKLLKKNLKSF